MNAYFDHENLQVYQLAREFNRAVQALLENVPVGFAESKDNLRRGAKSIARNIAEGSGRWAIAEKIHFYRIAHGSATECAAALDELIDFAHVPAARIAPLRDMLARIAAMLIGLIKSVEALKGTSGR